MGRRDRRVLFPVLYPPKGQDDVEKPARLKDTKGSAEKADKLMQRSWGTAGVSVWGGKEVPS